MSTATAQHVRRARRARRRGPARAGVRWDRVGRVALLVVLLGVVLLYIGPLHSYFSTWQDTRHQRQRLDQLEHQHARLLRERRDLQRSQAINTTARRLGMVRGGERSYSISGLPSSDSDR